VVRRQCIGGVFVRDWTNGQTVEEKVLMIDAGRGESGSTTPGEDGRRWRRFG
jgi:hypothetical protein